MAPAKKKPPVTGSRQLSDKGRPTQSTPQQRPTSAMPGPRPRTSTRTSNTTGMASAKPTPSTFPNAPKPKLSVKVPKEWNAKTIYSGANMPRVGQPFTTEGRMAARGPLTAPGRGASPNLGLSRSLVKEMRSKTADVRPANKPAAKPTAKPSTPATKPAAKPAATTPRTRTTTSYGPPSSKIKFKGASQSNPLTNLRSAATKAANTVKTAASQAGKSGVVKTAANLGKIGARAILGRATVVGGIAEGLNENLNPNSAMNRRDAELLRRIGAKLQGQSKYGPRFKKGGTAASATKTGTFGDARDKEMARIKAIKGSPVLGPKKVGPKKVGPGKVGTIAQAFDKSFAAARKAGKSEFTFKGKKYNTKMK